MAFLISQLNNEAVDLMIDKQPQKAVEKFQQALCQLKSIIASKPQEFVPTGSINITLSSESSVRKIDLSTPNQHILYNREDMFLYFHALALEGPSDEVSTSPATLTIYGAVVLFNLAILYHIEGIVQGRMQFMDRAHQMYQNSLYMLNGQDLLSSDTVLLLHLAGNNNLSQIELEKGMVDAANQRLRYTFNVLQRAKSRAVGIFPRKLLHGFLLNSSLQGKISSAPAA